MTKWKKVLAIIIALALVFTVFSLTSCSSELSSTPKQGSNENIVSEGETPKETIESRGFIAIEKTYIEFKETNLYQFIMYDPVTLVMWTYVEWGDGGGLSPMYNPDGTMRIYSPEN